jgi:hypothetical protein|tara:strand:- start:36 stop:227 length:192 start_codon:yes stop_codon:yes gene_type:complete
MGTGKDKKKLTPIEQVIQMPQLMFVPHDRSLFAEMKRFREVTKQGKHERKMKEFYRLNPNLKR